MRNYVTLSLASAALLAAGLAPAANAQDGATGARRVPAEMNRAQVQDHAAKMFARMDANKDGKLDSADHAEREKARFERMDADGNGTISLAEFTAPRQKMQGRGERAESKQSRRMPGFAMRGFGRGGHGPDGITQRADKNGDGAVTQDEFTALALARFDKADTNGDGKLTPEERSAARPNPRDRAISG